MLPVSLASLKLPFDGPGVSSQSALPRERIMKGGEKKREQRKSMEQIEANIRYRETFASRRERRNIKINVSMFFWEGFGRIEKRNS